MKRGKKICNALRNVRRQIALANDIPYETTDCHHEGDCLGTCPKCEAEVRYIENQLSLRRAAGKAVSLVGLSLGISAAFASCTNQPTATNQATANQTTSDNSTSETNKIIESAGEIIDGAMDANIIEVINESTGKKDTIYIGSEQLPEFPDGEQALMDFIKKNQKYPASALEKGIQGRVTLSFVVEKDGSISNIEVMRSPAEELTQEAIRVVKKLPKFIPGKMNGEPVRVKYVLPFTFRLQ